MVPAVPQAGALIADLERDGRYLRVSPHPESGRTVLSIWQGDTCIGTVRLDDQSTLDLLCSLARCLPAPAGVQDATRPTLTVVAG